MPDDDPGAEALRARDLGIVVGDGTPGPLNAITDVAGVRVGHATLINGDGTLVVGNGPIRTGVTVVLPLGEPWRSPAFAGTHCLNGNGELTGVEWVRESGLLTSPIGLTNTHSVGVVRDALVAHEVAARGNSKPNSWSLPVVGETWDGLLNDVNGFHVRPEHVSAAIRDADMKVAEGCVGAGTGTVCHGFKGGIGTASRRIVHPCGIDTVGILVQANHGRRSRLTIEGVPVGREPDIHQVPNPDVEDGPTPGSGSIVVVVATDAPLLPHQCARLAQRAGLGIARTGGVGEPSSGDLFICFATGAGQLATDTDDVLSVRMAPDSQLIALFDAVIEATEEAILNALLQAETMTGRDGITAYGLDGELLLSIMHRHRPMPVSE